jgi:hypothetical protein
VYQYLDSRLPSVEIAELVDAWLRSITPLQRAYVTGESSYHSWEQK